MLDAELSELIRPYSCLMRADELLGVTGGGLDMTRAVGLVNAIEVVRLILAAGGLAKFSRICPSGLAGTFEKRSSVSELSPPFELDAMSTEEVLVLRGDASDARLPTLDSRVPLGINLTGLLCVDI